MKKRLLVLGLAFTMLAATACGTSSDNGDKTSKADKTVTATNDDKKTETQKNDDKDIKKEETKENYKSADDITMDDLKNHEETPGEDFKYRDKSNGEAVIKEYTCDDPIVVIPNEIDGKKVVDFGKIFTNDKDIVAVKVGDNVEEIADGAFTNCDNLKYVILGKNVKKFNDNNVGGKKLEALELNDGLEELGTGSSTTGVIVMGDIDVKIPESVKKMDFACKKAMIVKAGSYAESYAKENNMDYRVE